MAYVFFILAECDCDRWNFLIRSLSGPALGGCVMMKIQREQSDVIKGLVIVEKFMYILKVYIEILVLI